jgi:hypothetical protein
MAERVSRPHNVYAAPGSIFNPYFYADPHQYLTHSRYGLNIDADLAAPLQVFFKSTTFIIRAGGTVFSSVAEPEPHRFGGAGAL